MARRGFTKVLDLEQGKARGGLPGTRRRHATNNECAGEAARSNNPWACLSNTVADIH